MSFIVCIPSKGRSKTITSDKLFNKENTFIFIPEDEFELYEGNRVSVPSEIRGITGTRNFILDWCRSKGIKNHIQVDDDATGFFKIEKGKTSQVSPYDFHLLLENMFEMTEHWGAKAFGFGMASDPKFYRCYSPFSTQSIIAANIIGIIENECRFDEKCIVKEDYDYSMQHIYKYKRVIRLNKYFLKVKHLSNVGGCVSYRTFDTEKNIFKYLLQKWEKK